MSGPEVLPLQAQRRADVSKPQVWGPVPPRNPDFVGRKQLLEQLHHRLKPGATAVLPEALHGMGGIGKTQAVVEYLYRHASEYDLVWWIPAEHPAQITASLVELAEKLGIPEAASADTAIPAVLDALRRGEPPHSRWILVFDDADSPQAVRQFIPAGTGHVLITSRAPAWAGVARPVEVNLFNRAESKQFLNRDNTLTDADADRLAAALGDLPLALGLAAAWLAETGMRVEAYLALLERNLPASGPSIDHQLLVAAACDVSLNRGMDNHPAALQLLQVCAFLGSEPVSRDLLLGLSGAPVPKALAEVLSDPVKLDHAMRQVGRYGLARFEHRNNMLQLHRMVQAALNGNWPRYSAWWADPGKNATKPRRRVFLSHSHHDRDRFVMAFAKSIEDDDVDVWLDCDDMPLGRDIAEEVADQINSVDAFIVVVSGNTQDSNWVRREVNMAVRRADRDPAFPVICLRLDGVDAPAVLSGIASIKINSSLDHLPHLEKILRAIHRTT